MRFGNLLYTGKSAINLGDVLMPLTVNHLYEKMGVGGGNTN